MAEIRLIETDRPGYELPMTCAYCGEHATRRIPKKFTWHPPLLFLLLFCGLPGVLILVIVVAMTRKVVRIAIPLCYMHRHHWRNRTLLVLCSFLVVLGLAIGGGFLAETGQLRDWDHRLERSYPLVLLGMFVAWLAIAVIANSYSIRPKSITEDTVTIVGVSPHFVEACLQGPRVADLGPVDEED